MVMGVAAGQLGQVGQEATGAGTGWIGDCMAQIVSKLSQDTNAFGRISLKRQVNLRWGCLGLLVPRKLGLEPLGSQMR